MFRFPSGNMFIYIIIAFFVISNLGNFSLEKILFILPGVLIAITFHEFAHAWCADKLGDDTPRNQGRLNLNPISHLDPIGSVLLVFAGFGWGKPVEINPRNFRRDISMTKGEALVSVAGPLSNFILAIIFLVIIYICYPSGLIGSTTSEISYIVYCVLYYAVMINIGLGIFNLIPLPPLDGSKILNHFLPYNARVWFADKQMIFYIAFLVIWITGLSSYIITPIFDVVFNMLNGLVGAIFRLF